MAAALCTPPSRGSTRRRMSNARLLIVRVTVSVRTRHVGRGCRGRLAHEHVGGLHGGLVRCLARTTRTCSRRVGWRCIYAHDLVSVVVFLVAVGRLRCLPLGDRYNSLCRVQNGWASLTACICFRRACRHMRTDHRFAVSAVYAESAVLAGWEVAVAADGARHRTLECARTPCTLHALKIIV